MKTMIERRKKFKRRRKPLKRGGEGEPRKGLTFFKKEK